MDNNNNIYFTEIFRYCNTMDFYSLIFYSGTRSTERAPLEVNLSVTKQGEEKEIEHLGSCFTNITFCENVILCVISRFMKM